ncbi:MAG: hypothetical protein RML72_04945 [Bacteroidia bacterium]|nr:hypothetical protein [Bacteroidia bacterium]MDW8158210.1 hypothetical protein [Bacteroidia bacterium]
MITDIRTLENRISQAKEFLNNELTNIKTDNGKAIMELREIDRHLDTIHEVERIGLRYLSDIEFARIQRTLTSLEARMGLSKN